MESVFLKTLVLTLSNPLTILFWVGVFSTKVSEENMNKKDMYYFGLGAVISTMTFLTTISVMGSFINNFLESTIINTLNFIVGLVLIAFGIKTAVYNQMKNSKYKIKMNQYPENIILEKWEKADKTQKTVLIDSSELDLSIEIDGYENTSNDVVVSFLLNIREVDNIVQKFCKNSFQQGKFDIRNYMVSLEWVTFDTDKVVMGYWGEFVNIELRAIFLMKNGIWEKRDIYYQ
jgi:putative Mn2+ efflux pump MntP